MSFKMQFVWPEHSDFERKESNKQILTMSPDWWYIIMNF